MNSSINDRFFIKVNKTDNCWEWIGHLQRKGYGWFSIKHKSYLAHRISWILHNGEIKVYWF
jgi:hypothetical protein